MKPKVGSLGGLVGLCQVNKTKKEHENYQYQE